MTPQHAGGGESGQRVVNHIGHVAGPFNQYNAPVTQSSNDDVIPLLVEHIAALRRSIIAAQEGNELSSSDSKAALMQLEGATAKVRASRRDRRHLSETLDQVRDALSGGLGILAQVAAVIAAIKGL
jgi:hypothetical protein